MTKRRTRCVTVSYRDNMHLDVTPMQRRSGTPERESRIFHHRAEALHEPGSWHVANPYGFAQWFQGKTSADQDFAEAYASRTLHYEQIAMATTDSEPVPPQAPSFRKSKAVIVLQLLKRWRNVQYDTRSGRRPPSIMISKLVADGANNTNSLSSNKPSYAIFANSPRRFSSSSPEATISEYSPSTAAGYVEFSPPRSSRVWRNAILAARRWSDTPAEPSRRPWPAYHTGGAAPPRRPGASTGRAESRRGEQRPPRTVKGAGMDGREPGVCAAERRRLPGGGLSRRRPRRRGPASALRPLRCR